MLKYVTSALAACLVVSLITTVSVIHKSNETIYRERHTLVECNSRYLVFQGNREAVSKWAIGTCDLGWSIVANQDYDDTID